MTEVRAAVLTLLALCATACQASPKGAEATGKLCQVAAWDEKAPVSAPKLQVGSVWTYVPGKGLPVTEMTLSATSDDGNVYALPGGVNHMESASTYAERVPGRAGNKVLIRFPLKVGATWEDSFKEEGEFRSAYEHYRYDYEEHASSRAMGLETVDVAAGRFRVIHIARTASWTKSKPRMVSTTTTPREGDAATLSVSGLTITHIWYAPTVGRAVLKASIRVGHAAYMPDEASLLNYANASVVELQSYVGQGKQCRDKPALLSGQPDMYVPIGYPLTANNTWQWALQMREHRPRRAE